MALLLPYFTLSGGAAAPAGMPVGQWLQPAQGREGCWARGNRRERGEEQPPDHIGLASLSNLLPMKTRELSQGTSGSLVHVGRGLPLLGDGAGEVCVCSQAPRVLSCPHPHITGGN